MEGYIIQTVPEQKFRVCSGCEHYSHNLVRSGNTPIYNRSNCNHPKAPESSSYIMDGYTPGWCPVGERKIQ